MNKAALPARVRHRMCGRPFIFAVKRQRGCFKINLPWKLGCYKTTAIMACPLPCRRMEMPQE